MEALVKEVYNKQTACQIYTFISGHSELWVKVISEKVAKGF